MDQVLIFANPISGRGRGQIVATALRAMLARQGFDAQIISDPPSKFATLQPGHHPRAAIAIGGDGTLREVARWALRSLTSTGELPCPLLIVPMGTANLMGQHLGIRRHRLGGEEDIVAAIQNPRIIQLDAAKANDGLFLLVAGVGLDGAIVHEMDRTRRGPITRLSYILPALKAVATYTFPPITVTIDGNRVWNDQPALAFVGNVAEYGTGFPILPDARPDDGLLDVCVLPCSSIAELPHRFLEAATGDHITAEGVIYAKGKNILIESAIPIPVEVDGEAAGFTPLNIEMLPTRIPFIVGAQPKS